VRKRVVQAGQLVSIVECIDGASCGTVQEDLVELNLSPNAHCVHLRLFGGSDASASGSSNISEAKSHGKLEVRVANNASYTLFELLGGDTEQKSEVRVSLVGAGASCDVSGLMLGAKDASIDVQARVMHMAPHTTSRIAHRGIFSDSSKGTFVGSVFVDKCAEKTSAFQENKNLLLSDNASAFTKPELEINADDVKCSHGATVGQLSQDALFYLRSRGIAMEDARRILVRAFVEELVAELKDQEHLSLVRSWLENQYVSIGNAAQSSSRFVMPAEAGIQGNYLGKIVSESEGNSDGNAHL
jgi:Fe-S cluster assembly protein SufD